MSLTRVIAYSIIAAAISAVSGQAQNLRNASPPAEFPPASFSGKQYVDSRGCIYIRAGIDGNVTWVPRVGRDRKQVCGFKPTAVAGGPSAPARASASKPIEITVPAATQATTQKTRPLPPSVANSAPASKPVPVQKPRVAAAPVTTVRRPAPVAPVVSVPRQQVRKPVATAPRPAPVIAPRRAPAATGGACSNASAFSQQYINRGAGVRCGPQGEPPVTYGRGWDKHSSLAPGISPRTRAVPRHVYDQRRNTQNVAIPEGYRSVWSDDRLNPHRAERQLTPAHPRTVSEPPAGYRTAARDDDRLNPNRGPRSSAGDAQSDRIWTRTVPRTLAPLPTDRQIVSVPREVAKSPAEAERGFIRLSTRSAPVQASAPNRYVRVATFGSEAQARQVAQALARGGLPMRLGSVQRGGATHRVVLAGPFTSTAQAQDALYRVQAAGYSGASLNN